MLNAFMKREGGWLKFEEAKLGEWLGALETGANY